MSERLGGRVLVAGRARGRVLRLDAPLSFWGGFDPVRGVVLDRHHPQAGAALAGRVVVMPESRGSAGTPAAIAEAIRRGTAPAAFLLAAADVNIATGALVAAELYGTAVPVLALDAGVHARLPEGALVAIDEDGRIEVAG